MIVGDAGVGESEGEAAMLLAERDASVRVSGRRSEAAGESLEVFGAL